MIGTAALLGAALLGAPAQQAKAATPGSGVLDDGHKSVTWQSPVYAAGTVGDPGKCPAAADDPDNKVCDRFDLKVSVPDGYWDDNPEGGVPVSIEWAKQPTDDFDMYVFDDAGKQVAASAGTADPEATVIPKADGTYHVVVVPYDVHDNSFVGKAYLPETTDAGDLTSFTGKDGSYTIGAGALKARADFLTGGQLRLQADPSGTFSDPAGSQIVRKQPALDKHTSSFDAGAYYGIRSAGRRPARLQEAAALRPLQGRQQDADLAGGQAPALVHRRHAAEPGARQGRAVLRRRRAERLVLAPRQDGLRREQHQLERGRLQQLAAVLPLFGGLRRLPQHLRARASTTSAPRSTRASRSAASTRTTSSGTRRR